MGETITLVCFILSLLIFGLLAVRVFGSFFFSRFAPVKTAKAQVVDKFKTDHFTKIYGSSHPCTPLSSRPKAKNAASGSQSFLIMVINARKKAP